MTPVFHRDDMDISAPIDGAHMTPSPCGLYLARIASSKLSIHATSAPEQCTEFGFRLPEKDITAVKWGTASTQVLLFSPQNIEVLDLQDPSHRVRLDNGSGGLGRFSSADFITEELLFVVWEFGRSKLWDLRTGKGIDLHDVKGRVGGSKWQIRPRGRGKTPDMIAMLSRGNGEDFLIRYFPASESSMPITRLQTIDAQSLSWSANGRWLVVVDTPHASPAIHIYTADGHLFRSYGSLVAPDQPDPGVKEAIWSPDHDVLAVTRNDGTIPLLNTRTFSPIAIIEHNTTINQLTSAPEARASVWEEIVSVSGERTYRAASQPFSPPLTNVAKSAESQLKGVVECLFSCDGSYLATRDDRMLNTLWVWEMGTLAAHAVIVQHSNVRRIQWHPSRTSTLLMDCGEGIVYLYQASSATPPATVSVPLLVAPSLRWIQTTLDGSPAILATTRTAFRILYPEGRDVSSIGSLPSQTMESAVPSHHSPEAEFEEGHSEDSLFDILSGRKPQHRDHDREMSYTQRIELETEEEDSTARLDDTFREKRSQRPLAEELEKDPLDDSQIF